uniref:hypothetical protein n=1 Tax=Ornithobacterium rhinotracheale TaxID=28251 RepID=UPI0039A74B6A
MDGQGNINVNAPKNMTFTAGENLNINVGQNMTTNVGMNKSDIIGMNHIENVGAIKTTSVVGDANMFITGKLTEIIEGDVHSETKQERNEVSDGNIRKSPQECRVQRRSYIQPYGSILRWSNSSVLP